MIFLNSLNFSLDVIISYCFPIDAEICKYFSNKSKEWKKKQNFFLFWKIIFPSKRLFGDFNKKVPIGKFYGNLNNLFLLHFRDCYLPSDSYQITMWIRPSVQTSTLLCLRSIAVWRIKIRVQVSSESKIFRENFKYGIGKVFLNNWYKNDEMLLRLA